MLPPSARLRKLASSSGDVSSQKSQGVRVTPGFIVEGPPKASAPGSLVYVLRRRAWVRRGPFRRDTNERNLSSSAASSGLPRSSPSLVRFVIGTPCGMTGDTRPPQAVSHLRARDRPAGHPERDAFRVTLTTTTRGSSLCR